MIWISLGLFIVLMGAPFILSLYNTRKKKRTILSLPDDTSDIPFRNAVRHITDSKYAIKTDSLVAPAKSVYEIPLYINGDAHFGKSAKLFAAHAKTMTISEKSHVRSSLDADEYLSVGEECELLGSAGCNGNMDIAGGTSFYDLFARKIHFSGGACETGSDGEAISKVLKDLMTAKKPDEVVRHIRKANDVLAVTKVKMDEGSSIGGGMISKKTLSVGKDCCVIGDISTEKNIELEDGSVVFGNVISQKSIKIGSGCRVKGNVFVQECVEIHENVTIGTENQIKSVVAGDTVSILGNSTVYGRVRAVRGGIVMR